MTTVWDNKRRAALRSVVARLYPRETRQRSIVDEVGLPAAVIGFEPSADSAWFNIIEEAQKHDKLDAILKKARAEYPYDESLKVIEASVPSDLLFAPPIGSGLNSRALGATPAREIDVLIITAIPLEYDAVLSVDTGAVPSSTWLTRPGPTGFDLAFRSFLTPTGSPLRIAVTRPFTMGVMATAAAAAPLVTAYRPRCLAMCGVCAGRRGHVNLGDVIIADTLWTYDTGAIVVEADDQGRSVERFKADPLTYNLSAFWKHRAETFLPAALATWVADRPRSYEHQIDWLLARLHAGDDLPDHPDRKTHCADYSTLIPMLRKRGLLKPTGLRLTPTGRATIEDRLLLHPDGLPEPDAFIVRVGPIGTGTDLVRDPHIFDKLSERQRKVLGLEMEAAAIGAVAHLHDIDHALVMKGVMDHADLDKSDNYKPFAARASAECLIAFLRDNLG